MNKQMWSIEKDELLIELVKNKPGLYDLKSPYYSDTNYKKKTWDEIEKILELNGAKVRWESLRSQYRKYLAKLKTKSGQGASNIFKWRYCEQMVFLKNYLISDRTRITSITDEEMDVENSCFENNEKLVVQETSLKRSEENDSANDSNNHAVHQSTTASANSPVKIKKKKITRPNLNTESASSTLMKYILDNQKSNRQDSIDQFFSLMATTVKKFSPLDQHLVKTQVFSLINKIEEKYLEPSRILLPSAPIHNSQISPGTSSDSSSTSYYMDISQSIPHSLSRDCPTPSQHTFIQQAVNPASYYDSSSGLKRSTAQNVPKPTIISEHNLQAQYSSTIQHQGDEGPYQTAKY